MLTLDLGGKWTVRKQIERDTIPATVPGTVHADLLAAGRIKDPYHRDEELRVQWIGETDWVYERSFEVNDDMLERDRVLLKCDGLDTFASVRVNGRGWKAFDPEKGDVDVTRLTGRIEVQARY